MRRVQELKDVTHKVQGLGDCNAQVSGHSTTKITPVPKPKSPQYRSPPFTLLHISPSTDLSPSHHCRFLPPRSAFPNTALPKCRSCSQYKFPPNTEFPTPSIVLLQVQLETHLTRQFRVRESSPWIGHVTRARGRAKESLPCSELPLPVSGVWQMAAKSALRAQQLSVQSAVPWMLWGQLGPLTFPLLLLVKHLKDCTVQG